MKPQEKKKCTLLIKNCTVMLPDCSFMTGASIAINGDRIIELDATDKVEAAFLRKTGTMRPALHVFKCSKLE
ncbi:hypothetical protein [Neomoorella thermoacetica]|uniref:hypothetical protein n=1 Tax=Neomoorella thermoacetica TaxID=1525 RepID=UPI0008FB2C1C|nr:hypothetical protein [Moorella thermoacetica]OIQ53800.1 hypothetical protein MORE_17780 [Moorella thermoacetica]